MGNTPSVARNLSSSTANYFSIGNLNLEVGALYLHTTDLQILEYSAQLLSLSHTPAYLYAGTTKDVQELLNEKDQVFSEETKTNLREELENRYGSHIFLCYKQDKIITIDDCSDIVGDFKIISFQDVSRHAPVSPEKRRNVLIDCLLHFGKDYSILARYCDYISEVIGLPLSDLKYALENTRLQSAVMYIANAFDCIPAKGMNS